LREEFSNLIITLLEEQPEPIETDDPVSQDT